MYSQCRSAAHEVISCNNTATGWQIISRTLGVALLATVLTLVSVCSHAAPISLAFDAEVTNIFLSPTADFELPFQVKVGDPIHGRFTFEPSPLGSIGQQDTGIRFEVAGTILESPTYDIRLTLNEVRRPNRRPFTPDDIFPKVDEVPLEPGPLEYIDIVTVACSFLSNQAQCVPGIVPGATEIEWRPTMLLAGDSPILSGYDLIGDPLIWNRFTNRSLTLHFWSTAGGAFIDAIVGPMKVVPEPPSWQLTVLLLSLILTIRAYRAVCAT